MVYLNNAATTLIKPETVKTAAPASEEKVKESMLKLLGMKNKGEVVLTPGGAAAVETALKALIGSGDHVIATVMEHDSTCQVLEELASKRGVQVSWVGINSYGALKYDEIESMVKDNTSAIICIHGCAVTGNINDLEKITTIARRHNLMVISDGCQTVGATEINLENMGVDVFCFTAHKKLMGPYGVGGICVKNALADKLVKGMEEASEKPEKIDEEKLGQFAAALDFVLEKSVYQVAMFPHRHAKRFFEAVKSMDAIEVYGNFGTTSRVPIVSITVKGFTPQQVKEHMRKAGIVVETGLHHSQKMHEALGTSEEGLVRFSFGYFNTRRDVNDAVWMLMDLVGVDDLYLLS